MGKGLRGYIASHLPNHFRPKSLDNGDTAVPTPRPIVLGWVLLEHSFTLWKAHDQVLLRQYGCTNSLHLLNPCRQCRGASCRPSFAITRSDFSAVLSGR
jgi:hypothetical protein